VTSASEKSSASTACDAEPSAARILYCAALLAGLVLVQARAELTQVERGYRPFLHAPSRVPYSWDMFAIRLDRCVLTWDPPLSVEGQRVGAWRDRTYPIEFDTVYNRVRDYGAAAVAACGFRTAARTRTSLTCATADGRIDRHAFDCP